MLENKHDYSFGFTFNWMNSGVRFFEVIVYHYYQCQTSAKPELFFDTQMKLLQMTKYV